MKPVLKTSPHIELIHRITISHFLLLLFTYMRTSLRIQLDTFLSSEKDLKLDQGENKD